ncbi:MAG: M23 family metallopeptidase [Rhodobacteraceae bacterium]|nr:M23 family metallopeptidase [Paracoccaceae bacterium]
MTALRLIIASLALAIATTTSASADEERAGCAISRGKTCDIADAIARGLFETGLTPIFPSGLRCRQIDEAWAISYRDRRGGADAYHGGIDIPAPFGTSILAAADGEVVAIFEGRNSYRGREIVLRHSPAQTGLKVWTFSAYSHFKTLPKLKVGDRVRMGTVLGPTGNSGRGQEPGIQSKKRRPAIHFAVTYSSGPDFRISRNEVVVPRNGWWADPLAFLSGRMPLDSRVLAARPASQKAVAIGAMLMDGTIVPPKARVIWPYACQG